MRLNRREHVPPPGGSRLRLPPGEHSYNLPYAPAGVAGRHPAGGGNLRRPPPGGPPGGTGRHGSAGGRTADGTPLRERPHRARGAFCPRRPRGAGAGGRRSDRFRRSSVRGLAEPAFDDPAPGTPDEGGDGHRFASRLASGRGATNNVILPLELRVRVSTVAEWDAGEGRLRDAAALDVDDRPAHGQRGEAAVSRRQAVTALPLRRTVLGEGGDVHRGPDRGGARPAARKERPVRRAGPGVRAQVAGTRLLLRCAAPSLPSTRRFAGSQSFRTSRHRLPIFRGPCQQHTAQTFILAFRPWGPSRVFRLHAEDDRAAASVQPVHPVWCGHPRSAQGQGPRLLIPGLDRVRGRQERWGCAGDDPPFAGLATAVAGESSADARGHRTVRPHCGAPWAPDVPAGARATAWPVTRRPPNRTSGG